MWHSLCTLLLDPGWREGGWRSWDDAWVGNGVSALEAQAPRKLSPMKACGNLYSFKTLKKKKKKNRNLS